MKKLSLNNYSINMAEDWNELSLSQLKQIVKLFYTKIALNPAQWKYAALYKILNIKWFNLAFLWSFLNLSKEDIVGSLFPLIAWLEKGNTLTDFKIKYIIHFFTKYYPPKDELLNITIDEFRFTDQMYVNYKKTKEIDYLNGLIAILYRKKRIDNNPNAANFKGDIRINFNQHHIIKNAKWVSKISLTKKQVIFWAYEGSRNKIIKDYPHLFKDEDKSTQGRDFGYGGLILELSGNKFGDFNATCKINIFTAFNFLEMEAIKIEKQSNKN